MLPATLAAIHGLAHLGAGVPSVVCDAVREVARGGPGSATVVRPCVTMLTWVRLFERDHVEMAKPVGASNVQRRGRI